MPRPNRGPQLKDRQPKGYTRKYWFAVWYQEGVERSRSSGLASSGDAERDGATDWFQEVFLKEWEGRRDSGPLRPRRPHEITCSEILTIYTQGQGPHVVDLERFENCTKALLPYWDEMTVAEIKGESCRAYARYRAKAGTAPGTIKRELVHLRAACGHCKAEGYLSEIPGFRYPKVARPKDRWLTRSEAARLVWAARKSRQARLHLPLFILMGLYMGPRSTAALSLQFEPNFEGGHVDLDKGLIDFNPLGRPETDKRRPVSPIPRKLLPLLRVARERNKRYVFEHRGERIQKVKTAMRSAVKRAGLTGVTPHTLRHTCCTWLALSGTDRYQAARFIGMDPSTFEEVYAHHAPDYLRDVAEALS